MNRRLVTGLAVAGVLTLATGSAALAQKQNPCAAKSPGAPPTSDPLSHFQAP